FKPWLESNLHGKQSLAIGARKIDYRETRLCACQASGSTRTHYEATFETVREVGERWALTTEEAGRGFKRKPSWSVSDGAVWIHRQAKAWLDPGRPTALAVIPAVGDDPRHPKQTQ